MKVLLVDLKREYQEIKPEVETAIFRVIRQGKFILGEELERFERQFAKFCGTRHCVGVNSGTDALILSLNALGINKNDEVIIPANTFAATAAAVVHLGARPVLVDVDPNTLLIDCEKVKEKISKKTKAVVAVHLHGKPADMDLLKAISLDHGLKLIEDSAHAVGASYKGKKVGSFGDAAIFSFYPSKNLGAYGDAGAVVTKNKKLAESVRILRNQGRKNGVYTEIGYNSILDNLQAAVLFVKLKKLAKWNRMRAINARIYIQKLANLDLVIPGQLPNTKVNWQYFVIRVNKRDKLKKYLLQKGVRCGIHYPEPIHLLPAFKHLGYKKGVFPVAEKASREMLSLPMFPQLTDKEIEFVTSNIRKFLK